MTFTAQPMRDASRNGSADSQAPIPGQPGVTSPSQIRMRDASRNGSDGFLFCGKPRRSMRARYCDDGCFGWITSLFDGRAPKALG